MGVEWMIGEDGCFIPEIEEGLKRASEQRKKELEDPEMQEIHRKRVEKEQAEEKLREETIMYGFNGKENDVFAKHIHDAIEEAVSEIYDNVDPDGIDLGMFKDILVQWADEIHRGVNFVIYGTKQEDDDHLEEPYVDAEFVDNADEFEIYNGYQE